MGRLRNPTATTRDGRAVYTTFDGKFFFSEAKALAHEAKKNDKVIADVEREAFEQDIRGLKPAASANSHGHLDEGSDKVLAKGDVFLRVIFYNAMAPFKGLPVPKDQVAGYRTVMASAHNPTHKQAGDWAWWASNKYNRGTTHLYPETYDIFTYRDPFFGKNITVIDIGMGS